MYLLDCAIDDFTNDEEEECQEDANYWESAFITGGIICGWKKEELNEETDGLRFLLNEQKLQAHTFNGIALNGSITSPNVTGR